MSEPAPAAPTGAAADAPTMGAGHDGLTPLMLAAQNGHAAAALVLCQAGSDVHHSKYTEYGLMNCIDIAVFNRRRAVAKILREFA
jgi:ankyrin repeat protein